MPLTVVILAAGQGKRMASDLPKVLQPLAGRPLLAHVVATARALEPEAIHVVYGHGGERVRAAFAGTSAQGADTPSWLATSPEVAGQTGGYYVRRRLARPNRRADDPELARRLWSETELLASRGEPRP